MTPKKVFYCWCIDHDLAVIHGDRVWRYGVFRQVDAGRDFQRAAVAPTLAPEGPSRVPAGRFAPGQV